MGCRILGTEKGVHSGKAPRLSIKNHSCNTEPLKDLNWGFRKGFKLSDLIFTE